jgi:hypothetical protein
LSEDKTDRLEIIKSLLLDEDAIGEATVFKVTVLQSSVTYEETTCETEDDFRNTVLSELKDMKPFSPRQRSSLSEGFLQFQVEDNKADFYYIREVAFRWEFVNPQINSIYKHKTSRFSISS